MARRETRRVAVGGVGVGGGAPVSVQSMTNTPTSDVEATSAQIERLTRAGCEIVRVAVPDEAAVRALPALIARSSVPVVADIHFDHRLAVASIEAGAHAIRINPGNIGSEDRVRAIVEAAQAAGVPIRIGVNAGSLEKDILEREGRPTAAGLFESCMRHVALVEGMGFSDLILSVKASDVLMTVEANRAVARACEYPLHLGVTEAGTVFSGAIRSAVGLGVLLEDGIGDTIRVSLAGPPEQEVAVGRKILASLGLRRGGVSVIACPTCARATIDVAAIADEVERRTAHIRSTLTVAVMGCVVNGPGEAREADVGIAGGGGEAVLFSGGEVQSRVDGDDALDALLREIEERTRGG
ncbi:MAG: flavodoxin-dependent (E)-4-hydroxy-3-methylbut-2-enyl-diphosphate synthase [Candidatus Eisenbacteria bacterium]|nr:flavodoxin-dependent (E)-4-hydroxy-3-methylbut-2-enyl-diphosphate synthase [Candidatus Eisenbacteria bacterium]